jgi:hypothetical protein
VPLNLFSRGGQTVQGITESTGGIRNLVKRVEIPLVNTLQEFLELLRKTFLGNMQEFLGNDVFPENFPGKYS